MYQNNVFSFKALIIKICSPVEEKHVHSKFATVIITKTLYVYNELWI